MPEQKVIVPTSESASRLIHELYGVVPEKVARFPTGNHHYVFDCQLPDGREMVARIAIPSERDAIRGGIYWNHELYRKGYPLPELYFSDVASEYPYMILEKIAGKDIGQLISSLNDSEMDAIAKRLMQFQSQVAADYPANRFGYAVFPEEAPHASWVDELRSSLELSRRRIQNAGIVRLDFADEVEQELNRMESELRQLPALAFLHDITTKNVMVFRGQLVGIVDIDSLCFGDPLFQIALTRMALLSDGSSLRYSEYLLRYSGSYSKERLDLYTSLCCLSFMGEIGQEFNGLNQVDSLQRKRLLELIFQEKAWQA